MHFLGEWLRLMTVGEGWPDRLARVAYVAATAVAAASQQGGNLWVWPAWSEAWWEMPLVGAIPVAAAAAYALVAGGAAWAGSRLRPLRPERVQIGQGSAGAINLLVRNPNRRPIENCYGKVVEVVRPRRVKDPLPSRAFRFPWSAQGGGSRLATTIAAGSCDVLDLAFVPAALAERFALPTLTASNPHPKLSADYSFPAGTYRVVVELGSDSAALPRREIGVRVTFDGQRLAGALVESPPVGRRLRAYVERAPVLRRLTA